MWVFIIVLSVWHLFLLEVSQRHVIAGFFLLFQYKSMCYQDLFLSVKKSIGNLILLISCSAASIHILFSDTCFL